MARILDYVSPAELERFENQDFFDEDERERLLPPKKPRGRPRKGDIKFPSFSVAPIGEETSREQSLLPQGSILIRKRRGRPKGTFRKNAVTLTSTKLSVLSDPSVTIKKARGRPPRQKHLPVIVPAFNGPQPQHLESSPGTHSESDEILDNPKPQYSMIAASGLGQTDTEDLTSRDQSVELMPPSKKRRLDSENVSIDPSLNDHNDDRSSSQTEKAKTFSDMSPDPIADDSIALLRQFQARVYGPDHSEKGSSIPHRQGKPSLTNDDSHLHTPRSSLGSSSSDSLTGHIPRRLKVFPTENEPSKSLPEEKIFQGPPGNISTKVATSYIDNSITASHSPRHHREDTPPIKSTSPSKSIRMKISLTPHFPPSMSFSKNTSKKDSAESRSQPSLPPASRHVSQQPTNPTLSPSSRITPPSLIKKRKLSPQRPNNAPSRSSQASSTSKVGFAGLPQAKNITDYFSPKPPTTVSNPPPTQPRHSPSTQLLGPKDSNGNSKSYSDSDSISSEVVFVRPNRVVLPTAQAAATPEPRSQEDPSTSTSSSSDQTDPDDSEAIISSEAESEAALVPPGDPTAPLLLLQPTTTTTTTMVQSNAEEEEEEEEEEEAWNQAFELSDHDEGVSADSDSDTLNSEVMIIRPS